MSGDDIGEMRKMETEEKLEKLPNQATLKNCKVEVTENAYGAAYAIFHDGDKVTYVQANSELGRNITEHSPRFPKGTFDMDIKAFEGNRGRGFRLWRIYNKVENVPQPTIPRKAGEKESKVGKIYVLNSPVLTEYGTFEYRKVPLEAVEELLDREFTSAVGHEATASFMSKIIGREIPVNRIAVQMETGDSAVVFHLLVRLPEGKILSEEEMEKIPYEIGILRRIS